MTTKKLFEFIELEYAVLQSREIGLSEPRTTQSEALKALITCICCDHFWPSRIGSQGIGAMRLALSYVLVTCPGCRQHGPTLKTELLGHLTE